MSLREQKIHPVTSENITRTTCFFTDLEEHLINQIQQADGVIGCIAWLTNAHILNALKSNQVSLVVQNESFLSSGNKCTRTDLRRDYAVLSNDFSFDAIRVFGKKSRGIKPIMHHKYLVFLTQDEKKQYQPTSVWTGSFNLTKNGTLSVENAVLIEDSKIAQAYYEEWVRIYKTAYSFK